MGFCVCKGGLQWLLPSTPHAKSVRGNRNSEGIPTASQDLVVPVVLHAHYPRSPCCVGAHSPSQPPAQCQWLYTHTVALLLVMLMIVLLMFVLLVLVLMLMLVLVLMLS